jgi:eukaryotic-like serine/threonine-protein kinase
VYSKPFQDRVEEICQEALDCDPSVRAAFLTEACAGDEALRSEVDSLLACERAANQFMAGLAVTVGPSSLDGVDSTTPPASIGAYEVLSVIGSGGMGRVYRARDPRLARDVAIKVLPPQSLPDRDSRVRFEHEARTLAALNHPNIATIYGVEDSDSGPALVLELVTGETLADRLAKTLRRGVGLPISQALDVARQVADAMESAHERGIVHRDLKPANIAITPAGTVKVLDFGIASSLDAASMPSSAGALATTRERFVLGTPGYMSPEQAQGLPVDKRSDIWAFGCVLYEMLTGSRAFGGDTTSSTLAAVMSREPDWDALPSETPLAIRQLLRRCLTKEYKRRLADIADARLDLDDATTARADSTSTSRARWTRRRAVVWGTVVVAVSAAVVALALMRSPESTPRAVRFDISVPQSRNALNTGLALSPDGAHLAFVAPNESGEDVLWLRRMDTLDATPLVGTENAYAPIWSPDSQAIAFFAGGQLKRVSASGGPVQVLCEAVAPAAPEPVATWNPRDDILFAQTFGPLLRVSADGGTPTPATTIDATRQEFGHYNPVFLPDGEHFLYWAGALGNNAGLFIGSLQYRERTPLAATSEAKAVSANGVVFFLEKGVLNTRVLDVDRMQLTASSVTVAERVAAVSVAHDGTMAYREMSDARRRLTWFDRTGKRLGTVGSGANYEAPALSPDGRHIAAGRDGDIWLIDALRGSENRLTTNPAPENYPLWSPDGSHVIYMRGSGFGVLVLQPSSGVGQEEIVSAQGGIPYGWSKDGRFITLLSFSSTTLADVYVLPLVGDRQPTPFLQTRFQETGSRPSPDGKWIAYTAAESGRPEIFVQTFPASGKRWPISTRGGTQPFWRDDGKELFYLGMDGRLMAVAIGQTPDLDLGIPRPLFQTNAPIGFNRNSYVPAGDGQRFLVNEADNLASRVVVVLHSPR